MLPRSNAGFTLLEIIVALAIAAAGIAAVAKYTASAAEVSYQTEERMLAVWAAGNRLAELRITRAWPAPGSYQQQVDMGGRSWYLTETVGETGRPELRRVEVVVYTDPERGSREFSLQGYLSLYVPPEQAAAAPEGEEGPEGSDSEDSETEDSDSEQEGAEDSQPDDGTNPPEDQEQTVESPPEGGPPEGDEDEGGAQ